jgi:aromatic-L-amino-acid decarboxylase
LSLTRGGLQETSASPLVIYTSAHSHSSVGKAALLAGFGREHIRVIPHDSAYAMRADALAAAITADRARGFTPCAIVATCGSTTTTAMDPLREIGAVAAREGVWLHVDAAMAGSACRRPPMPS